MREFDLDAVRARQAQARAQAAQDLDDNPDEPAYDAAAIVACTLCDDDGYRGLRVCDHVDYTAAARTGMAKVRAALAQKRLPTDNREDR